MIDFGGKVFSVTGGASGIGLAISEGLIAHGARVALLDLPASNGKAAAAQLSPDGTRAAFYPVDVTDTASLAALPDKIESELGSLGGVVANAGIAVTSTALDYTPELWRRTMTINLDGTFFTAQAFARHMQEHGGSIVLTSSIAGQGVVSPETHAAYGASKAAVAHLASLLGTEWGSRHIRVNAVAPGYTDTPILQAMKESDPETLATWISQMPIGRLIKPSEIADAVIFLLSDMASAITGAVLQVNGGYHQ